MGVVMLMVHCVAALVELVELHGCSPVGVDRVV